MPRKKTPATKIKQHIPAEVKDVFFYVEGADTATSDEVTEAAIELLKGPRKEVKIPPAPEHLVKGAVNAIDVDAYNRRVREYGLDFAKKSRESTAKNRFRKSKD